MFIYKLCIIYRYIFRGKDVEMVDYRFEVTKKLRTGSLTKLLDLAERRFGVTNHKNIEAFVYEQGIRIDSHKKHINKPNEITFLSNGKPRSDLIIYQYRGKGVTDNYILAHALLIDDGDVTPEQMQMNHVHYYPERQGKTSFYNRFHGN